jgi:hypothetical protein
MQRTGVVINNPEFCTILVLTLKYTLNSAEQVLYFMNSLEHGEAVFLPQTD